MSTSPDPAAAWAHHEDAVRKEQGRGGIDRHREGRGSPCPAGIPALRDTGPGKPLAWSAKPDGTLIVRVKTKPIRDMAGMLKAPQGKVVGVGG